MFLWINILENSPFLTAVADSAREINELELLLAFYQTAIREARRNLMSNVAIFRDPCLAALRYIYVGKQNKAIRIWYRVLGTFAEFLGRKQDSTCEV